MDGRAGKAQCRKATDIHHKPSEQSGGLCFTLGPMSYAIEHVTKGHGVCERCMKYIGPFANQRVYQRSGSAPSTAPPINITVNLCAEATKPSGYPHDPFSTEADPYTGGPLQR